MDYRRALPGPRLIYNLAVTWGVLALAYLFIPSFNPKDGTVTDLLQYQAGKITRVYQTQEFFRHPRCHSRSTWPKVLSEACKQVILPPAFERFLNRGTHSIILEIESIEENGTQYLKVGGGMDPLTTLPFDLGYIPLTETRIALNFDGLSHDANATISDPFSIRVAATRWATGKLAPRWLTTADTELIAWWFESHDSIEVPLRVLRNPFKDILEVWPEHWEWDDFRNNQTTPSTIRPLISVKIPVVGYRAQFARSLPAYPMSSSPTMYTLPARLVLLLLLIPVGYLGYGLVFGAGIFSAMIALVVSIVASLLVIALASAVEWWFRNGRPSLKVLGWRSGAGFYEQRGRQTGTRKPDLGEIGAYTYEFSLTIRCTPAESNLGSLDESQGDPEAETRTTEAQSASTSRDKQPASQEED